jgi:hypothetical protein
VVLIVQNEVQYLPQVFLLLTNKKNDTSINHIIWV